MDDRPAHPPKGTRRGFLCGLAAPLLAGLSTVPLARVGAAAAPERALRLHHLHTGETVRAVYFADGRYLEEGLIAINRILRDWRTGEAIDYDPRVLDIVHALRRELEVEGAIEVFCGYRSPATNALLRRRSHGVAKNSLHMRGMAIDLRFPGRDLAALHRAALALRAGGVGYYPASGFVHLDSGPVRHWAQGARARRGAARQAAPRRG